VSARWQAALAYALVAEEFDLTASDQPDPEALLSELAGADWDAERIGVHARTVIEAEQPWPHPVPAVLRQDCGPAQFHAALARTRELLDLRTMETRTPTSRHRLTADEERLMRDVPPHHGH
jgi:hypothetical protein